MTFRNHWRAYKDPIYLWTASPLLRHDDPRDLLEWTLAIIDLGEQHGVARFRNPSGDWWARETLREYLEQTLSAEGVVDAFEFSGVIGRVASRLAYFVDAEIAEDWIVDPGALLGSLTGATRDETNAVRPTSPLWLSGHRISFGSQGRGLAAGGLPCTSLRIELSCDIWLPWVRGWHRPDEMEVGTYDNRELASRNAPRLNAFLAGVRELTLTRGGTWEFFIYSDASWFGRFAADDGIRLDAEQATMRDAWG